MEDGLQDVNLSSRSGEEVEEKRETEVEDGGGGGGGEERRSGGLLDNLIHNYLVSPLSPRAGDRKVCDEKEKVFERSEHESSRWTKTEKDHVGGGGGLIKNVISNLFRPNEAQAAENEKQNEEAAPVKNVEENGVVTTEEEGGRGGGGIIDNIVSHLPASLLDDRAVPSSGEASILIHSIIRD